MILDLFVPSMLAALSSVPPASSPTPLEIRDIAPPVDVFPYPLWMVIAAGVVAATLCGLLIWLIVSRVRNRPAPPPPGATAIALRELEQLRQHAQEMEPYAFSIAVSDVLRTFVNDARFHLPATHQTSPEFLAAISGSPLFSDEDRALLARFLEWCDMIKFARLEATSSDNVELVESALTFVKGGPA
jgi:hypothetical protein